MTKRIGQICITIIALAALSTSLAQGRDWEDKLDQLPPQDWDYDKAKHLLDRAGFGGTPSDIEGFVELGPDAAVDRLINPSLPRGETQNFEHSGIHDPGIEPFPPSRPAATKMAKETGEAIGVRVKPAGNRRLQPVVDRFFYWLRASMLETQRVADWWGNRMLTTSRPLTEKMALFWHGHFATSENKVRDYRKMLQQNNLFRKLGTTNFREILIAVSQDPAMLAFLDAGVNVKGSPNENFAREIMELFTMGVGQYSEEDIREAARAFTGWNYVDLKFVINEEEHDNSEKTFLGRTGKWDGIDIIDMILEKPETAEYISAKIYKFFVRQEISPSMRKRLGTVLYQSNYDIAPLLRTIFLSKDFYSVSTIGTRIKSPVELLVSTYKKLELTSLPGVPDFHDTTRSLGQRLLFPPTVAGWAGGQSWVTPGLLLARGNFVYDAVFPDINFIPADRYPSGNYQVSVVAERLANGEDVATATRPADSYATSASNDMVDRDEEFNTRLGSYRGWRLAIERVRPIERRPPRLDLTLMLSQAGCRTAKEGVNHLVMRFFSSPIDKETKESITKFLVQQLGTSDLTEAQSFSEQALRETLHLLLSLPEYQLG